VKFVAEGAFPFVLKIQQREGARAVVLAAGDAREAAEWVVRRLRAIGYRVDGAVEVGASREAIEGALRSALSGADLVVVVGGVYIGSAPAFEAVAAVLGRELVEDEEARRMVEEYYYMSGEGGAGPPRGRRRCTGCLRAPSSSGTPRGQRLGYSSRGRGATSSACPARWLR